MKNRLLELVNICTCGLLVLLSGCYDLDQLPNDSVVIDFNDPQKAYEVMIGVYESLNDVYNGLYSLESATDLGWSQNGWWPAYDKYDIAFGVANASYGGFSTTWTNQYECISRANNMITNMGTSSIDENTRIQYIAESRFLRALMYNNLLNYFGGVPIYDESFTGEAAEMLYPRNTADEVRNFVLEDLAYAIEHLPETAASVGQASQGTAYALRGKVYLFNEEYEKAKADFMQVVNGGYGYALHSSYADLFRPSGYETGADDCEEIIFAVEHMGGTSTAYGMHVQFLGNRASYGGCININLASQELLNMYECINGKPYNRDDFFAGISDEDLYLCRFDETGTKVSAYPPQVDKLKAMYDQRDPRMAATVILPYTMYAGWVNDEKMDCEMVIADNGYYSYEGNGYVRNAHNQNTYMWRKFVQEYDWDGQITDRAHSPVNYPIIRYADVLLMLAECYNQTDDQSNAVFYLNQVRARAGMPELNSGPSHLTADTRDEVFERIKYERAVEFTLEGIRFFDLRRWGELVEKTNGMQATDIMGLPVGGTKNIDEKYNLWAIPQSEIDLNEKLTQNPGW